MEWPWPSRTRARFGAAGMPCASCASSTREGRTVLYAFDPRRAAILLIGGDKTGNDRWYEENVPFADRLYDEHLEALRKEGLNDG